MALIFSWALAADWADRIDRARQAEVIEVLAGSVSVDGSPIVSRAVGHPDRERARLWLAGQLQAIEGLELAEEPFVEEGVQGVNLIATLPGRKRRLDPIVLSAHYDSIAALSDDWEPEANPAPGADDDASGCAAILEIARLLAAEPGFQRDIELILFDAEEQGLLGSQAHVRQRTRGVHWMISIDSIGSNTADGWLFLVTGPGAEPMETLLVEQFEQQTAAALTRLQALPSELIAPRSDHGPFIEAGWPASHLGQFPLPPSYHTVDDTPERLDPAFIADATATVLAATEILAEPRQASCGCSTHPVLPAWVRR